MDEYEPYKLTMNLEEEFSFSEFNELPEDGEFEHIEDEAEQLNFEELEFRDDMEAYIDYSDFEE
jgi:hypothetical protein